MYKSETITRPDGSKYVQCTRIPPTDLEAWQELVRLLEQEPMEKCIKEFGTSS